MKNGFTIVELLASIAIMSLIIIISVPAYEGISSTIKTSNRDSKLSMMEKSTLAFVNKYKKDEVYNGASKKICFSIHYLIERNVFSPDNSTDDGVTDPVNGGDLIGYLKAEYDTINYEVTIKYIDKKISDAIISTDCDTKYLKEV